jgi:hypothetical protein
MLITVTYLPLLLYLVPTVYRPQKHKITETEIHTISVDAKVRGRTGEEEEEERSRRRGDEEEKTHC